MTDTPRIITIDGPGGSGKGTISRKLAARLGWTYLDSGALYRLLGLAASQRGIALDQENALCECAKGLDVRFDADVDNEPRVRLDGHDVSAAIRTEEAGNQASRVAAVPAVREALLQRQRDFAGPGGLVADGRDMGTVVFPLAPVKVFLDASAEERAKRRYKQLKGKGISASLPSLVREIGERDQRDRQRSVSPLVPAVDAVVIDSTSLSIDEVVNQVMDLVYSRLSEA